MADSTSPNPEKVLELFEQMAARDSWLSSLRPAGAAFSRVRIYSLGVVIRLMIFAALVGPIQLKLHCAAFGALATERGRRKQAHFDSPGGLLPGATKTAHTGSDSSVRKNE